MVVQPCNDTATKTEDASLHLQFSSLCLLIWQVTENAGLVRIKSASTVLPLTLGLSLMKRTHSWGTSGRTGGRRFI